MPGPRHVSRLLATVVAAALIIGGVAVTPASAAASAYTLSYTEAPQYVLNDHTPFGVRFAADATSGLKANTTYYMKIRFSASATKPSGATNRGFTWNPDTEKWVQERGDWIDCPTVTTKSDASIDNTWIYGTFGDENAAGTYYIMVSLSEFGSESTYNPLSPPAVTVLDAATGGSWVHNGTTITGTGVGNARFSARSNDSVADQDGDASAIYSLWETEANGIDDDSDGLIDEADENTGPSDVMNGDYRSGVPSSTVVDIYTKRTLRANDFTTGPADCDIAVGAPDTTAPTAAIDVTATATPGTVTLSWGAATDAGGSGLVGYNVYRWPVVIADDLLGYATNPAVLIGTTAETDYVDTSCTAGIEYAYRVRAVDAATNVGPRSNTATAVALGANALSRDFGDDRIATALDISHKTFATGSVDTTVVVATALDFPDALAASSLAGIHGSPLLLVGSAVTDAIKAEITRLGATDVVLIGGTGAISAAVEAAFDTDFNVKRIDGLNRYETAANVAREVAALGGTSTKAYFVRGDDFADAISVSPFAYSTATPVLLVATTSVPAYTEDVIGELGVTTGMIAGGVGAVSAGTEGDLETLIGAPLTRWAGSSRFQTATMVADAHVTAKTASYNYVGVATGLNFPDALGGGAAAGSKGGVLLLTNPATLSPETAAVIIANEDLIDEVHVFGGVGAVSANVYEQIQTILQ